MLTQVPTPDPKCKPIISSFLTLPQLLDCLLCTRNVMSIALLQMMVEWDRCRHLIYIRVWLGEQGVGIILSFFSLCFCFFVLSGLHSPYLGDLSMMDVVSVHLFFSLFYLSLVPLTRRYWSIEIVVSVVWNYFKNQLSDHYSVDFLGLERVFKFHSLGCLPYFFIIIRLLGQDYHVNFLICYPCSFYFLALNVWQWKIPPLNDTQKE